MKKNLSSNIDRATRQFPGGVTFLDEQSVSRLREPVSHNLVVKIPGRHRHLLYIQSCLLKAYPDRYPAAILKIPAGRKKTSFGGWCPIYALHHCSSLLSPGYLYLPPLEDHSLSELIGVMGRLREKNGCPWDREQTHLSLRPYLVEEAYEVVGAIEKGDMRSLQEELGDLLLQVVFHAQIAMEEKHFAFYDVVHTLITKLVRRHPHVFGSQRIFSTREVKKKWDQIKKEERSERSSGEASIMHIDPDLPALMQAFKVQEKAARVGFDWKSIEGPLEKVKEERNELMHAYHGGDRERIEEELGDLLFALVNVSRFMGVNPELALVAATKKFADRFAGIEEKAKEKGGGVADFDLNQLDCWWKEIKKKTKKA